jgi:prepilin-type N-terminal cleavage/methylation domain-containing protein
MAFSSPAIDSTGRTARRRAFTLVESLLAAVVLAILAFGVATAISASYKTTITLNQTATAVALGRELLEEITGKPLLDPSSGTTTPAATRLAAARSTFTGAGNYNLYTDSGSALATLGGSTVNTTNGQSFTRTVSVASGAKPSTDTLSPSTDFALVTVTVTTPMGQSVKLQRVVANYTFTR